MVSVAAPAEAVAPLLASGVEISVVNGPEFCVIGGSEAALEAVLPKLRDANLRCQKLATSHAFHTWMMQDMLAEFRRTVAEVERSTPKIPFVSNVTGAMITDSQASDPEYWVSHVRNTVRFGEGIQTLVKSGTDVFVEVGPGTTLTALLREAGIAGISLLRHPRTTHNDNAVLMQGLAELWIRGVKVDWTAFHMHETRNRLSLPTYAFQRRHHWPEPPPALTAAAAALTRKAVHPLLGQRWSTSARIKAYENFISATEPGYLKDHSVMDVTIFPAAGYCEMALAAARLELGTRPVRIDRIQFVRPLLLRAGETRTIQTSVLRRSKDTWEFEILGRTRDRQHPEEDAWVVHSEGTFSALSDTLPRTELAQLRERITTPDSLEFYSAELIQYGPAFRGVSQVFRDGEEILARIELPEACRASTGYQFHPVLLDSSFQAVGAYTFGQSLTGEMLPVGLRQWDVYEPMPPSFWAYIKIDRDLSRGRSAAALRGLSFCFYGDDGRVLSRIGKYERKELDRQSLSEKSAPEELLYEIAWEEKERPAPAARNPGRTVFILTDDLPAADLLTRELATATGDEVVTKQYSPGHDAVESLARTCATNPVDVVMVGLCRSERAPGVLCEVLLRVVQTLSEAAHGATLTLVTAGAQRVAGVSGGSLSAVAGGLLWGFGSAVVKEHPDLQCLRVDLDPDVAFDPAAVVAELLGSRDESLVGLRGFTRYVARLTRLQKAAAPSADTGQFRVLPDEFGTFDSLQPRPSTAGELGHDEVEVELYVGALNFKETLIVLGMLPYGDGTPAGVRLGCEGSGRIVRTGSSVTRFAVGDDVIVWRNGCLASHIVANENELLRFDPRRLSFEQAACLPTVCMTAHLGLETYGKLRRGERVLIHAAAGGVGLAAVQLARALGAEIYATASREKWDFLRRQGIRHVFDSRSTGFADEVLRATGGKGVHLVLNSLAGDFIRKGFDILTEGGRFIELGKLDIWSQDEARNYRPDVSYVAFELGVGEARGPHMMEKVLGPQLSRMLEGSLEPLPAKVYSLADVASAFRRLAAGQTIGKVAIRIRDVPARRGNRDIRPDGAYVISGGSGALGLHVAEWLVEKGAREIVLLSRRAAEHETNPDVGRLRDSGAVVRLAQCDVADRGELAEVLEAVSDVAGVFHCAGILDDGVIQNQTRQRFDVVLQPKIAGVRNLHELTVSRGLDHFVCFSSTSALLDGGGQSNYAAANAYLDAFVAWRRRQGLPGVAIAWGGWSGGGMATRLAERRPGESGDLLSKEEGIEALEVLIERDVAQAICTKMGSRLAKEGGSLLYSRLNESNTATQAQATAVSSETLSRLDASSSAEELNRLLKQEIGKVLGLGADLVSDDTDFIDAGIDSLTMAELRNRINKVLPTPISAAAIFANSTVNALSAHIRGVLQSAPARDSTMTAPKQPQTDVGVVVLGPKHNERRLFCIPGIGNNIFEFQHLSESGLQATICVLPRDGQGAPNGVDEITWSASQNLKRMKDVSSHGPYALVGYSFGGTIAVEMAHQLIQAGEEVASLTLIDAIPWRSDDAERFERATYSAMFDTLFEALGVPESTSTAFYQRIKGLANSHALSQFREVIADVKTSDRLQATFADQMFEEFSRTARIRYTPPTRLGDLRITLCKAKRHLDAISRWTGTTVLDPRLKGRAYGWDGILANEIDVVDVDCSHFAIVRRPAVDPVVQTLRAALAGSVQ